ncbi:MAG: prepilin-type N-terminal cleavage/methylation domain-containing protein [bacterium]
MRFRIKGFTLIELIIVILILAVMSSISIPLFKSWYGSASTEDTASRITALLNYAHQKALLERKSIRFNIDTASRNYWLTYKDKSTGKFSKEKGKHSRVFSYSDKLTVISKNSYYDFTKYGDHDLINIKVSINQNNGFEILSNGRFETVKALPLQEESV